MSNENLLSVSEVANHFAVSTTAVYDWIKKGDLVCVLIGKTVKRKYVTLDSVKTLEAKRSVSETTDNEGRATPCAAAA